MRTMFSHFLAEDDNKILLVDLKPEVHVFKRATSMRIFPKDYVELIVKKVFIFASE